MGAIELGSKVDVRRSYAILAAPVEGEHGYCRSSSMEVKDGRTPPWASMFAKDLWGPPRRHSAVLNGAILSNATGTDPARHPNCSPPSTQRLVLFEPRSSAASSA